MPGRGERRICLEPAADERAVLADQRHEVGDGRQRDEVEVADRRLRLAGRALERLGELGGDRGPAEHLERVAADLRMDDRAVGQRLAGLVVVGDDDRDPGRLDGCDLGGRGDSAVDRHQQTALALLERLHRGRAESVAVGEAIRDQPVALGAGSPQRCDHDRGRADPVDVVVAVDGDPLSGLDRREDPPNRRVDPVEQLRLMALGGREELPRRRDRPVAASDERDRDRVGEPELVGDQARLRVVVGAGAESGWDGTRAHAREARSARGRNQGAKPSGLLRRGGCRSHGQRSSASRVRSLRGWRRRYMGSRAPIA